MRRAGVCLLAVLAFAAQALAQERPDARELFRAAGESLKQFKSYQIEQSMTVEVKMGTIQNKMEMSSTMAATKPDRMRVEGKAPMGAMTMVSDGEHT